MTNTLKFIIDSSQVFTGSDAFMNRGTVYALRLTTPFGDFDSWQYATIEEAAEHIEDHLLRNHPEWLEQQTSPHPYHTMD